MNWLEVLYRLAIVTLVVAGVPALNVSDRAIPSNSNNSRVLLLTNSERGQANIFLATSQSILSNHPSVEIHYASFPPLASAVAALSDRMSTSGDTRPITFHPLKGIPYVEKIAKIGYTISNLPHPPGLRGAATGLSGAPKLFAPWDGPEYVEIYEDILRVIDHVRPDLVVVDCMLMQAQDAVHQMQIEHVLLAPNSLRDFITARQPRGEAFWKFPITGSAFPYPLPWHLIPSNILVWAKLLSTVIPSCYFGRLHELTTYRKSHGIRDPVDPLLTLTHSSTLLVASAPEVEYPMSISSNIVPCGPIVAEPALLVDVDPNLASWLASAPTVLVNLGSHAEYDREKAASFAQMISRVLARSEVQVLWKFNRNGVDYSTDFFSLLPANVAPSRLRILDWVPGDMSSLLDTGQIICAVHHGGASSFHEHLAAGIPQVILPLWWDTYDYAVQAEWLGVGVWGNREHAPFVHEDELTDVILSVIGDHEYGRAIRRRASEVASRFSRPGRDVAAEYIVQTLRQGNQAKPATEDALKDEL